MLEGVDEFAHELGGGGVATACGFVEFGAACRVEAERERARLSADTDGAPGL